ncbi:MAG: PAS domain S-box protein, partial [Myxococcota bacterium]
MKDPSVRDVVNLSEKEVSCRLVLFICEQTEKRGIRKEELFEGLSYPAEYLENKHARIDWTTFHDLMSHVGQRLTDPELVEIGQDAAQGRWAWPFRAVGSLVRSRPTLWRRSRPRPGPSSSLVTCLRSTVREIGTNHYEIVLRMDTGYEPSRELFIAAQGFFTAAPRLLGLGSAEVELEEREQGVRYEIRLTGRGRLRGWLRWAATRPFAMGAAARELREGLEFLEAGYLELEGALAERIEIEEELRLSEERYRTITENVHDLIVEIDPERWRVTYASPNHREVLGFEPTEVQSMYDLERIHPEDRGSLSHAFLDLVRLRGSERLLFRIQHRDGRWLWFESFARSAQRASGEPRVVLVSRDITEKRRAEHELRSSEQRLRRLTENARDLIDEIDQEGRFVYVGPNHRNITGFRPEELYGESPLDHIHPDDRERVRDGLGSLLRTGAAEPQLFRFRHRDGRWLWFETQASRVSTPSGETRIVTVTRDVTYRLKEQEEKRRLEAQVRLTQKLESLGVLAGGIAHDFNNLLTPILGNADRGLSEVEADSPAAVSLERIRSASLRAAELANQLLVYAGESSLTARTLDLSEVTRRMTSLLDIAISPKAKLDYRFAQGLPPIKADVGQIQQVILNLITNASEAIGDRPGVISVRTGAMEVDRAYLARATLGSTVRPGSYVYLEVVDTGCGMDEATKARIFDPFYTTK